MALRSSRATFVISHSIYVPGPRPVSQKVVVNAIARQDCHKRRSLTCTGIHFQSSTALLDQKFDNRQADADATIAGQRGAAGEFEQMVPLRGRQAKTVV